MGSSNSTTVTGWREWVSLPGVDQPWIKAKIDTGASTSSLHAFDITEFERDGVAWARFGIHPWQYSDDGAHFAELPIADRRDVRSSSGHVEHRLVVSTQLILVKRALTVELTLTDRSQMGFRMLVGREALRRGFIVDPSTSFAGGRAPKKIRRANRGKL